MIRDDAKWIRPGMFELTCLQCGKVFNAARSDAKFCSSLCRKTSARRKEQMKHAADKAIAEIAYIRSFIRKYDDLQIAGALELDRIERALRAMPGGSVTTAAGSYPPGGSVTVAAGTYQSCKQCGEMTTVSPASGLCLSCLKIERIS